MMSLYVIEDGSSPLRARKAPPLPPLVFDPTPAKPKPVAAKPLPGVKPPEGKPADYVVETEEAKETTVEVYFTDGKGKFYETTPQVILINPSTGTPVRRFFRMVDANGNPDPQKGIAPGYYHLTFAETRTTYVNNVEVVENMRNKIIVKVNKASLSFEYEGNTARPVTEFSAVVVERNKPEGGKIINQKCTERLEYEPGNYHVVINTFPQDVRNIDLDFNEKAIKILQPGFAKFTGEDGISVVFLYQQLGDKYREFHKLRLSDPSAQKLQIQPGKYQAHFHKGPGGSAASEKVMEFIVKSNELTEVILK